MKRITSFVVKSLVTILIGATLAIDLQAQTDLAMTVNIPFPFIVGTHRIPPGTYRFSLVASAFQLSIVNVKTGHEEVFPVRPEQQRAFESHGRLIFRESGDRSSLNEVHFLGIRTFTEVIQPRDAGRLEAKGTSNSVTVAER